MKLKIFRVKNIVLLQCLCYKLLESMVTVKSIRGRVETKNSMFMGRAQANFNLG